jgi:hypothetical protein
MYYLVGKEFGIPPWEVAEADAGSVMQAFLLLSDMQPKGR